MPARVLPRLVLPLLIPGVLAAQERAATRCNGIRITAIEIARSERPPIDRSVPAIARPPLQFAMQGRTTREDAVRPFLLLEEGQRCSERRMRETERVLRAQPFLSDAVLSTEPDGAGGVRLLVRTVDEIPLLLGGRIDGGQLSGLKYGSTNLGGSGTRAVAEWREGFAYEDAFRGELVLAHTMGRPHRFTAIGLRDPLDQRLRLAWERPFWSTLQRTGWYLGFDNVDGHARLLRQDTVPLALPYRSRRVDVGGVARLGGDRLGIFAGPFVSHERFEPLGAARGVAEGGFAADADSSLTAQYAEFESSRASAVVGGRWLSFERAEGLDALEGPQDIARGVQAAALTGMGLGGNAGSRYYGADVFLGAGTPMSYLALRGTWEERRSEDGTSDALLSARLRWYGRASARSLLMVSAEYARGRDQRRPVQLALGDRDVGVRGLPEDAAVGAMRAVARADYRVLLGGLGRHVALAGSAFTDAGVVRAGDAPYGVDSDPQFSVGAALLIAVPRQSRRLWRIEAALPLGNEAPNGWVWRIGTSSPWREFWRDPRDVAAMRALIPPASLFGFP